MPVALHHLRALDAQLAHFTGGQHLALVVLDAHVGGRQRQADGAVEGRDVERVDAGGRRGLGQAVGLHQGHPGHLLPAIGHRPLHRHATAQGDLEPGKIHLGEAGRVEQAVEQGIDPGDGGEARAVELLDEAGHVAWIGDQVVEAAQLHEHQSVRGQGEDVVQRQGGDDHFLAALELVGAHPGRGLLHVGHQVAVGEHGTLGHAGGAAGVLQEGDVVGLDVHRRQGVALACRQRIAEAHRAGDVVVGHHLLHVLEHEVDDRALGETEHVAQAGGDDLLEGGVGQHFLHGVAEVVDHHDGRGARIDQLVLELARGVERIDVDHGQSRTQHPEGGDRVLQAVGHHDRDPITLLQPQLTEQVGGKLRADRIHFGIGQGLAQVAVGRVGAVARDRGGEHRRDGAVLVRIDLRRYALRIVLQPRTIRMHGPLPPRNVHDVGAGSLSAACDGSIPFRMGKAIADDRT